MEKTTRQYGRGSDMSCASLKEENISPFVRRAVSAPRSNEFVGTQVKNASSFKKRSPEREGRKNQRRESSRARLSLFLSLLSVRRARTCDHHVSVPASFLSYRPHVLFVLSLHDSNPLVAFLVGIEKFDDFNHFFRSPLSLFVSPYRVDPAICEKREADAPPLLLPFGRSSCEERESAHTTARWKGEEKFLKCFSWNERTFELVFFFSKFSILVQNESHKNKRKGEKSRALFEKEEETKTEKRVVVGRFFPPRTTHQSASRT